MNCLLKHVNKKMWNKMQKGWEEEEEDVSSYCITL
jgi:hypothetical protein